MNYNPSPKAEFIKNPENISKHHALVEDPTVRKHLEIALSEMARQVVDKAPPEMGAAAAAHIRLLGAYDFVSIFYQLAETPLISTGADKDNLPGNVRQLNTKKN